MPEESRKPVLYSAVQPSGTLTIGNYIGALRNFKLLEQDYDCLFCMADLHALTVRQEPAPCAAARRSWPRSILPAAWIPRRISSTPKVMCPCTPSLPGFLTASLIWAS